MNQSLKLNLPDIDAKLRKGVGGLQIYDSFRKKFVMLTPEEWVRQHFAHYLVNANKVPASLVWLEHEIQYGNVTKRPDISIMDTEMNTWCIVECKAPHIEITEEVFFQVTTYHSIIKPKFIAMTNGLEHFFGMFKPEIKNFVFLKELPLYV